MKLLTPKDYYRMYSDTWTLTYAQKDTSIAAHLLPFISTTLLMQVAIDNNAFGEHILQMIAMAVLLTVIHFMVQMLLSVLLPYLLICWRE